VEKEEKIEHAESELEELPKEKLEDQELFAKDSTSKEFTKEEFTKEESISKEEKPSEDWEFIAELLQSEDAEKEEKIDLAEEELEESLK